MLLLPWAVLFLASGMVLGYPPAREGAWWLVPLLFLLWWRKSAGEGERDWRVAVLPFLGGLLLMTLTEALNHSELEKEFWEAVEKRQAIAITGRLLTPPEVDGDVARFRFLVVKAADATGERSVRERVQVRLLLDSPQEQEEVQRWVPGSRWQLEARLIRPQPARNPGAFDYREFLRQSGVHLLAEVEGMKQAQSVGGTERGSWMGRLYLKLDRELEQQYQGASYGLMKGLLIGRDDQVAPDVEEDFMLLGLAHVLAISGQHVALVSAMLWGGLRLAGVSREKGAWVVALFIPFYALLTGGQIPVIRAAIMAEAALLAMVIQRAYNAWTALFAAAAVLLLWNPYTLYMASFHLSFAITMGLILWTARVTEAWPFHKGWLSHQAVKYTVAVTLIAQLVALPLSIAFFQQFTPLSILANLLLVPLLSLAIGVGYVAMLLGLVLPGWGQWLAAGNQALVELCLKASSLLSQWPGAKMVWPSLPLWAILIYYVILWSLFRPEDLPGWSVFGQAPRWRLLCCFLLGVWLILAYVPHPAWEPGVRVTFLDVGQGDAAVVETPAGVWMIDGGGRPQWEREPWRERKNPYEVGKDTVVPFLHHRGIRQLEGMVLTHGDSDHVSGLSAVARQLRVRQAVVQGGPSSAAQQEVLELLEQKGVPVYQAQAAAQWSSGRGVYWTVLHPDAQERWATGNTSSVVLLLQAYGRTLLFTGDVDEAGERAMLNRFALPRVDVLKVGHHGSATSTSQQWLDTIQPAWAVISVGEGNRYGHPAPEVLERLHAAGVKVLRTDRNGAVSVRIFPDGRMWVRSMY